MVKSFFDPRTATYNRITSTVWDAGRLRTAISKKEVLSWSVICSDEIGGRHLILTIVESNLRIIKQKNYYRVSRIRLDHPQSKN